MKNSLRFRRLLLLVVGCALTLAAEPAERRALPGDRAVLHFDVPAKAAVFVNGEDQGDRRRIEVTDLKPGELVERKVRFQLPGGAEQERTVLLAGGWEVRLAPLPSGARPELVLQTGHGDRITAVAFSPDGKYLLTGSADKTAILWEAATGRQLRKFQGHSGMVSAVAFDAEGKRVLTGAKDRTFAMWDVRTGARLPGVRDLPGGVADLAFHPGGGLVACLCTREKFYAHRSGELVFLWDLEANASGMRNRGDCCASSGGHADSVTAVAIGPDGRQVFTGSADGTVRLWDLASGDELGAFVNLTGGKDWLVVTPAEPSNSPAGGRQQVAYRVGGGLNLVPVDRFFQDFYRPGLLAVARSGERPKPEVELGRSAPPVVKIVSPAGNATVEESQVTLEAEVRDEGGGMHGPWLIHNGVRVNADGESERQDKVYRRRFHIALVQEDNRLEVHAVCGDGSQESEPALLVLRYETPTPTCPG